MPKSQSKQSRAVKGHELHIPDCILNPRHCFHPPSPDRPLRIQIQGPLDAIQKLLPDVVWHPLGPFPQPGGMRLAKLAHDKLYGAGDDAPPIVRSEYLGIIADVIDGRRIPRDEIDYYGVTFDHRVPEDDPNPEVVVVNIIELESTEGPFANGGDLANEVLLFPVDPTEYVGKKVLAVPRCCQKKRGTQDRKLINGQVAETDMEIEAR